MSPARVLESIHKENELQTLTAALDALLLTAHQLSLREQDLQRRVKIAHDEYKKLADRVEDGFTDVEKSVLQQIRPDDASQPLPKLDPSLKPLDVLNHLRSAGHIQRELADVVTTGVIYSRSIAERSAGSPSVVEEFASTNNYVNDNNNPPCVVAAKARRPSLNERDFTTTNGVTGSLRCPFAKPTASASANGHGNMNGNVHHDAQSSTTKCAFDPIKADLSQDRVSSAGASARSSAAARCPIRYMDDHSPEELAKYFENHKHEIPRSHAICVNRFQRNQATMKQIDAKYGSLVSMIQGLGVKHKALLPEAEQNGTVASSAERVEKWAEDVSSKSPQPATLSTVEEDAPEEAAAAAAAAGADESDARIGHFERPLREVRVGESPSRPWGIPVPVLHQQQPALSTINSPAAQVNVHVPELKSPMPAESDLPSSVQQPEHNSPTPARPATRPRGKCPFDHEALMRQKAAAAADVTVTAADTPAKQTADTSILQEKLPNPDAQYENIGPEQASKPAEAKALAIPSPMVFNGPVFFGYSAEETAALMQQLSSQK